MQEIAAPANNEDFASELARFACSLTFAELPASVVTAAKIDIADTLACAAAGSSADAVVVARELAVAWSGAPQATILGYGDKVPAQHAAWVNGTMAHASDYDDTHDAAVLHAGVSVIPAALAAAELCGCTTGADFIAGVVAGLETICRLGVATDIGIAESGWMYTPLFGYFAATVAAGRVLRLSVTEMVNALGIVYSQAAGNHQVTRDGAQTKAMQPGFAAKSALMSVQLARHSVRGAQSSFEGVDGFLRVYLRDRCNPQILREGLGERYEFTQLSFKPYPCCRLTHTSIEGMIALRALAGDRATAVNRIRIGVSRQAYEAVCTPGQVRKTPHTAVHAQFSIPFTAAVAWLDGGVNLTHFSNASLRRQDVLDLARRIEPFVDSDIERDWGRSVSPAEIHAEFGDGTTCSARVDLPLGHPSRPMTVAAHHAKAGDCLRAAARPLQDDAAARLRQLVNDLETLRDIGDLVRVLVAQP